MHRLEGLLESLHTYSRAGEIARATERVDTRALVERTFDLLSPPAAAKLRFAGDLPVFETPLAPLALVFRNLIGNAIKHAGRDDVTVTVGADDAGEAFAFSVGDDGPGIEPAYQDRIFELFQTLKPRDEVEGSGLGLAIVKRQGTALGGAVDLHSKPGAGALFRFTWKKSVTGAGV